MSYLKPSRQFRFGLFEADLQNALLTRKGVRVRLQEQPFRILAMLLDRAGQIVTREELQKHLWPTGTYVDFDGSLNAALKRLRTALDDEADNPRFIETIPRRGYRFIAPVAIEDSPTASEEPESPVSSISKTEQASAIRAPARRSLRPWQQFATIAALLFLVAITTFLVVRKRADRPPRSLQTSLSPAAQRRSIAVLGFHNTSGKSGDAWLSTALTEMLRTELGAGDKLRVVSGEQVEQFRLVRPWPGTDSLSPGTASRVGKALDGDVLVLGSYATLAEQHAESIRVDFRLQDARTGELLYEGAETGAEKQFFGLVAKVGVELRERLGLPAITESEEVGVLSSLPSSPEADRLYSLGLEKLREEDFAAARDLLLQAETIAPDFPLVHLMLSRAWGSLGYDQKSRAEAEEAFKLSASLSEDDKLLIEGAYYESMKNLDKAAAAYRALYALYPDSVDYAERLIVVLNASGRREEALAVVKELRRLPPPASEDPRIDFWQAKLISYSNGPAARPYIEKAVAEAASRGQRLLYARFRLEQCRGSIYTDQAQHSMDWCQEAYGIFMTAGNRLDAADALRTMGDRTGSQGDFDGAREYYHRALAILSQLGEHEKIGAVINNMAITEENQGRIDDAERLFTEAEHNFEECGDAFNLGVALGNIGDIFLVRGNLRAAEKQYQHALRVLQPQAPVAGGYELDSISEVRLLEGDIAGARRYADQAFQLAQKRGAWGDIAQAASSVADVSVAAGDLSTARQKYGQALEIRQKAGDRLGTAQMQAALASVDIEEGKPADAEAPLRKSLAEFHAERVIMDEAPAQTDLSRVLLQEGKLADARQIISDALALTRAIDDPALKLPVAIMDARIEAAELASRAKSRPDLSEPRRKLQNVVSTARQLGYYGIECDARLALGEIEMRIAPATGRSHLAILSNQAHDRGMDLVSRKAGELLQSSPSLPKLASAH